MKHPQNAEGKFWIDQAVCVACSSCFEEAPHNIKFDDSRGTSFVYKQPETDEELHAVREAVEMCPVEAPKENQ